jgi:hypothetical protein
VSRLDEVLPRWDVRERHRVAVDAQAEVALAAVKAVTLAELPAVRVLFRLRALGRGAPPEGTVLEAMLRSGFRVLAESERELVVGAVGRPWRVTEGLRQVEDVTGFDERGYARMAMDVRADGASLATETRVLLTSPGARRAFRAYWLVIRPWSGLVRRVWLRAAARRALRG